MQTIHAHIYGKDYALACDTGQEAHLQHLVREVDARTARLETAVGKLPEALMLLYTALMTADELHDAQREIAGLKSELARAQQRLQQSASSTPIAAFQEDVAQDLFALADRLNGMAGELEEAR